MTPSQDMRLTFEKKNLNGKTVISLFLLGGKKNRSVFTFSKKNWIQLPGDATFARVRHSFVSFKGNLFVFGGLDEQNKPTNDLWISKNEWNKPILNEKIPPPRFDHSAVIYKNVMIIHGGRNNDNKICDTWLFDFNKMEWNQIKLNKCVSIVPRSGHSALIVNQFMLIFGGEGYENHPFALNIETMRIIKLKFIGNYVLGMNDYAADIISNPNNENKKQIICFGGFNADKSIIINSFTKLYLTDEITNPSQMPSEDI